jgi:hypothetical protein
MHGHVDVAQILIELGAHIGAKDNQDWTPLHHAALYGHRDVAEILLECGADLYAKDKLERAPLQLSLVSGHAELSVLLIEKCPGALSWSLDGMGPAEYAAHHGRHDVAAAVRSASARVAITSVMEAHGLCTSHFSGLMK